MAVDEAILDAYEQARASSAPTLRLYGWRPAAWSLGKSQPARGAFDPAVFSRPGVDLVRRPTGGTAVLHEFERTYAVVGALGAPPFAGGVLATYRALADAIAAGLRLLGVAAVPVAPKGAALHPSSDVCFDRTGAWEIEAGGRKLVGCAQARRRGAFLQHGSIPTRLDAERLSAVAGRAVDASRFTDLTREVGHALDDAAIDRALVTGIETTFGVRCAPGELTEGEALRAAELRSWKYDSIAWTRDGAVGEREARWGPVTRRSASVRLDS
jgi:lipoate-protein ligase A